MGLCRRLCPGAQGQRADEVQSEFPLTSRPFWALSPGKRWSPRRGSGDAHLCLDYLDTLREGMEGNRPPPPGCLTLVTEGEKGATALVCGP